jgi:hypothetical protein
MSFKNIMTVACFGAALGLAGFATQAAAQGKPTETPIIQTPAAGAAVSSPVTVSYQLSSPPPATASGKPRPPPAFLVIDAPLPATGTTVYPDAQHVPFPKGEYQLSVTLAPGQHQLQIVLVNHKGLVTKHFQPGAPVNITVK